MVRQSGGVGGLLPPIMKGDESKGIGFDAFFQVAVEDKDLFKYTR